MRRGRVAPMSIKENFKQQQRYVMNRNLSQFHDVQISVPLSKLIPNKRNPRRVKPERDAHRQKVASIRAFGLIAPLVVRADDKAAGGYPRDRRQSPSGGTARRVQGFSQTAKGSMRSAFRGRRHRRRIGAWPKTSSASRCTRWTRPKPSPSWRRRKPRALNPSPPSLASASHMYDYVVDNISALMC